MDFSDPRIFQAFRRFMQGVSSRIYIINQQHPAAQLTGMYGLERILKITLSLAHAQFFLRNRITAADQTPGINRDVDKLPQLFSNQFGLIISPLSFPSPMQRNGNDLSNLPLLYQITIFIRQLRRIKLALILRS